MSRGINKVILIEHLGDEPEIRYTAAGNAITNIRLATTNIWKDKNGILSFYLIAVAMWQEVF
jgi:single-strand DNA-binding protein